MPLNHSLLLLSHFSCVRLCDPIDAAHRAPPSLGFSRQEHWSGLPFPSPMHDSEKWKWSCSVVSNPQRPHGLQPSRLLRPWDFPGKSTGVGCHCLLRIIHWEWLILCDANFTPTPKEQNQKTEDFNSCPYYIGTPWGLHDIMLQRTLRRAWHWSNI